MPERVTREERQISLLIQKAREAKEMLYQSLMDNNRSPEDDDSEAVKLKRPKAENYNYKAESNDGPATLHAYAGEITKMVMLLKNILPEDYETNPFLDDEKRVKLISQIDGLAAMLSGLSKQIQDAKPEEQREMMGEIITINRKLKALEEELSKIPEQTKFYDSEYSAETYDSEYNRSRAPSSL
jgi:seryl-tRNA synthetase|tara:strand:- start:508 stop:1059 length:552 start_codon:yes stop_codon:yes gene_type:complete